MQIPSQTVDLLCGLNAANEFEAESKVFHELSEVFNGLVLYLIFLYHLVRFEYLREGLIVLLSFINSFGEFPTFLIQKHELRVVLDFNDVVQHRSVDIRKTSCVLITLNFSRKINLSHHQFSQQLKFANLTNSRYKLNSKRLKLLGEQLITFSGFTG